MDLLRCRAFKQMRNLIRPLMLLITSHSLRVALRCTFLPRTNPHGAFSRKNPKYEHYFSVAINRAFPSIFRFFSSRFGSGNMFSHKKRVNKKEQITQERKAAKKLCIRDCESFFPFLVCSRFHFNINKQIG